MAKKKNPPNRPPKEIDWEVLEKICRYKVTLTDAADIMKVHHDTLRRKIRDEYGCTFTEYRNKYLAHTKLGLQTKAIQMALGGNPTMMIFCLKNLCLWQESPAPEPEPIDTLDFIDDNE